MELNREKIAEYWTPKRLSQLTAGKSWLISPLEDFELLMALGLMGQMGEINHTQTKKLVQINHMLQIVAPFLKELAKRHQTLHIIDAACGTSALSLVLAWVLKRKWSKPFHILGIDSNPKVVATSQRRAELLNLHIETLWQVSTVNEFQSSLTQKVSMERTHMILALHACDQATDQALILGLKVKADIITVAPCCHRELAHFWKGHQELLREHPMRLIFKSPQLRHEVGAHFTDALRLGFMRSQGYEVTALEFVPSVHTPKNRLLVCERRGLFHEPSRQEYVDSKGSIGHPQLALERLWSETLASTVKAH